MADETDYGKILCARFQGRAISFDHPTGGPAAGRLVGTVESARYLGRDPRGDFPIVQLTCRGKSGAVVVCDTSHHYPLIRE